MATVATFEKLIATSGRRRFTETTLPVCGATVRIRSLTERELSGFQARVASSSDAKQRAARLEASNRQFIAMCLVDDDGNLLVPPGEAAKLADMDAADSAHLYDVCSRHTGINKTDIEDLVKNSEMTTPNDSPTS